MMALIILILLMLLTLYFSLTERIGQQQKIEREAFYKKIGFTPKNNKHIN